VPAADPSGDDLVWRLQRLLEPDRDVLALALFGSSIREDHDEWSDVDALVALDDGALPRYAPSVTWLGALGEVFAHEHAAGPFTATTRVCFADFRRLDLVFATASALERIGEWPAVPFWAGCRLRFARSPWIEHALARRYPPPAPRPPSAEQFEAMADHFWSKGALAVVKVVRADLLIALHLALDLVRDCCVLQMLLRDRAEGTSIHRQGGVGNQFVAALDAARAPYTAAGILDSVERSAELFDALATQWSANYAPRRLPLLAATAAARRALPREPTSA
jgi:hypothetical protein